MATPTNNSSDVGKADSSKTHLVVAAIDFGTTFTGYAFTLTQDSGSSIYTSQWCGNNTVAKSAKAPTVVLLTPAKEFLAFGYKAQDQFADLIADNEADNYYYFERFKMKLYETKKLKRDTTITDIRGKSMPAIEVFTLVIKHLKEMVEKQLENAIAGQQDDDILWLITVPAIWSDGAKQFMREAANKAGIDSGQLKLVLEPEAASLYCNSQKTCKTTKLNGNIEVCHFPEGHKYIVADLGGGTADLSVYEILPDRNLKEIRRANGDAYGGILVDKAFSDFLVTIFGRDILQYFTEHHTDLVLELQQDFETKKRNFDNTSNNQYRFKIPKGTLTEVSEKVSGKPFDTYIHKARELYQDKVKFLEDKLIVSHDVMETFFTEAVDGIIKCIREMRSDDELNEINTLLMVGGFAESEYVREKVRADIPGLRIIVPVEPSLSVLKGAVLMGLNPKVITERVARFTYGFSVGRPFQQETDPEKLKFTQGGRELCHSVFKKVIEKGQVLKYGDSFRVPCMHGCLEPSMLFSILGTQLYKSLDIDPQYCEEEHGCELVGVILKFPPIPLGWDIITLFIDELVVGESEFTVKSHNVNTGETLKSTTDFL